MPTLSVYVNCDTILAINLKAFNLNDQDEFVFVIKNYNYIDSPYMFIFRAKKADMNQDGEVIFKVPQQVSSKLKAGAFYNISVLTNAFDTKKETIYRKLTDNGKIILEYGAQNLVTKSDLGVLDDYEILDMRLELIDDNPDLSTLEVINREIVGLRLELVNESEDN
jgi:hypothetical protein